MNISTKKDATKDENIDISSLKYSEELIQIEVQCCKNCFKNFLPQDEVGAFGNNKEKEPQKLREKLKKYVYYIFTKNICFGCNPKSVSFWQKTPQFFRTMTQIFSL